MQPNLMGRDYVLLIDKSGSMGEMDGGTITRWKQAEEATVALARKCMTLDPDGITVIPFNNSFKEYKNVDGGDEVIKKIFLENEPMGSTDTALALGHVLNGYFADPSKPMTILVVTDGAPTSEADLQKVIVDATKRIKADEELAISFLQVGKDINARAFLKRLDDDLVSKHGAAFDIVDTKTMDEMASMTLEQVLTEAITD